MSAESTTAAPPAPGLLFNWQPSRRRKLSIFSFVIVSLALHALGFYLFQIIYPPAVALLPAPGRVNVISPTTEQGRQMLRWIEAEDPALGSTTQRPPDAKAFVPPKIAHVPAFTSHQPALRQLPPYAPEATAPDPQPPGPVVRPRPAPSSAAPRMVRTAVQFAEEAASLGAVQTPDMHFARSSKEAPAPAQFRVAISPAGDVRYCFLQAGSGDGALDEQARQFLALCRFAPQNNDDPARADLFWTNATIVWGNDLAPLKEAP